MSAAKDKVECLVSLSQSISAVHLKPPFLLACLIGEFEVEELVDMYGKLSGAEYRLKLLQRLIQEAVAKIEANRYQVEMFGSSEPATSSAIARDHRVTEGPSG